MKYIRINEYITAVSEVVLSENENAVPPNNWSVSVWSFHNVDYYVLDDVTEDVARAKFEAISEFMADPSSTMYTV